MTIYLQLRELRPKVVSEVAIWPYLEEVTRTLDLHTQEAYVLLSACLVAVVRHSNLSLPPCNGDTGI